LKGSEHAMKLGFPLLPPGIHRIKIGNATRLGAGNQAITGLGFKPKIVIFLGYATGGVNRIESYGFDDGVTAHCMVGMGHQVDMALNASQSILLERDGATYLFGHIASMDADGFTITWTLAGTPFTGYFVYLAMR